MFIRTGGHTISLLHSLNPSGTQFVGWGFLSTIKGECTFMNLLERVLTLLRANLNAVVEKSDDPEKTLRQLQLDMRNQLVQVKTQVATTIAESRKLQKRSQEKAAEAEMSLRKAEQAVQQGNDDAARTAL